MNTLKDKAVYLVGRYQSGCKDDFCVDKFDTLESVCSQYKDQKNSSWKCLSSHDLSVLLVTLEAYVFGRGLKLHFYNGELSIVDSDFDKWFRKCDLNNWCKGLCIDDKSKEKCTGSISEYNENGYLIPSLFLLVHLAHNTNSPQTYEARGTTELNVAKHPRQTLYYFSSIVIDTFFLGYCTRFKELLKQYYNKFHRVASSDDKFLNQWEEWKDFKEEVMRLNEFWKDENPRKHLMQFDNHFVNFFNLQEEQNKTEKGMIYEVRSEKDTQTKVFLHSFLLRLGERALNTQAIEENSDTLKANERKKSVMNYIIDSIEKLEKSTESFIYRAVHASAINEELNKMLEGISI